MKHDELMELAKQAGFLTHPKNTYIISPHGDADEDLTDELARFFRLAYARGMLKQEEQTMQHWSDCAVHSEPAYPAGECDCGGLPPELALYSSLKYLEQYVREKHMCGPVVNELLANARQAAKNYETKHKINV